MSVKNPFQDGCNHDFIGLGPKGKRSFKIERIMVRCDVVKISRVVSVKNPFQDGCDHDFNGLGPKGKRSFKIES